MSEKTDIANKLAVKLANDKNRVFRTVLFWDSLGFVVIPGSLDNKQPLKGVSFRSRFGLNGERMSLEDSKKVWIQNHNNPLVLLCSGKHFSMVVVDVDDNKYLQWAIDNYGDTPFRVKTSRGTHLYYRSEKSYGPNGVHPVNLTVGPLDDREWGFDVNTKKRNAKWGQSKIDIKSWHSYVVGHGASKPDGFIYTLDSRVPEKLPKEELVKWVQFNVPEFNIKRHEELLIEVKERKSIEMEKYRKAIGIKTDDNNRISMDKPSVLDLKLPDIEIYKQLLKEPYINWAHSYPDEVIGDLWKDLATIIYFLVPNDVGFKIFDHISQRAGKDTYGGTEEIWKRTAAKVAEKKLFSAKYNTLLEKGWPGPAPLNVLSPYKFFQQDDKDRNKDSSNEGEYSPLLDAGDDDSDDINDSNHEETATEKIGRASYLDLYSKIIFVTSHDKYIDTISGSIGKSSMPRLYKQNVIETKYGGAGTHWKKYCKKSKPTNSIDEFVFNPYPHGNKNPVTDKEWNVFDRKKMPTPVSLDKYEESPNIELFNELILHMVSGNIEHSTYIKNLLASWWKNPKQWTAAIIFSASEGTGKGLLSELLAQTWGPHLGVVNSQSMNSQFNGHLVGKVVLIGNEISTEGKNKRNTSATIKEWSDGSTVLINRKQEQPWEMKCYCHWIFNTNETHPFIISKTDRRYSVFSQHERLNQNLIDRIVVWKESGTAGQDLVNFFQHYSITEGFNSTIPIETDAKRNIVSMSESAEAEWWYNHAPCGTWPKRKLYEKFAAWFSQTYPRENNVPMKKRLWEAKPHNYIAKTVGGKQCHKDSGWNSSTVVDVIIIPDREFSEEVESNDNILSSKNTIIVQVTSKENNNDDDGGDSQPW